MLVSACILLGLLVTAGCQSSLAQSEGSSPTLEISPTVAPLPESQIRATPTPEREAAPESTPEPASPTEGVTTPDRSEMPMDKTPERVPPTEPVTPVTGEVPTGILNAILQDLAERTDTTPEQISVVRAQAVVWNDGSLGCPQPGVMYTQALVDGYWVELEVDGQTFDYRAARTGYFVLCENGRPPRTPPGGSVDR
jgi:hypothetical protein